MRASGADSAAAAPSFPRSSSTAKHRLKQRLLANPSLHNSAPPHSASHGQRDRNDRDKAVGLQSAGSRSRPRKNFKERLPSDWRKADLMTNPDDPGQLLPSSPLTVLPTYFTPKSAVELLINDQLDFLYLTPDPTNSYKLCILPSYKDAAELDCDLITMSKTGITRQDFGDLEVTHYSLHEYLTEYQLYMRIKKIPFFKHFWLRYSL